MKRSLAALAIAACAGCEVAGPVVDRLPEPYMPPTEFSAIVACRQPPSCKADFELESELTALRPLNAEIAELDEDAGIQDAIEPGAIDWASDSVVLASAAPLEVVLDEAPRAGILIELRGPVTLRLENIESLEGLRIASPSPESRVVLERVTALDLTLGDTRHRFAGRIEAKHTAFERASVSAASMQLDSSVLVDSFVATARLVSRDGLLEKVVLSLGDGLFAPSEMRDIDFRRCDALSFFGSQLQNVHIPRCRGDKPTRFYETKVFRGMIDGEISADTSRFEGLRFGRREATSVLMWGTGAMSLAFCDFADRAELEPGVVYCSECSKGALEELVCKLPQGEMARPPSKARYNFCAKIDEAERCEEPYPDRPRPLASEE